VRVAGLAGLGLAVVLLLAFVVAVVRADARAHASDPAALSGFDGWPRRLGLAAVAVGTLSIAALTGEVFG